MLGLGVCRAGAGALAVVRVTPATVVPREKPAFGAAMLVADKIEGRRVLQAGLRQEQEGGLMHAMCGSI